MIQSFADKAAYAVFHGVFVRALPREIQGIARRKLVQIDPSDSLEELRIPPGNRLEKLSGDRAGQWSIRINDQWQVCFRWESQDAFDVEIVDYH